VKTNLRRYEYSVDLRNNRKLRIVMPLSCAILTSSLKRFVPACLALSILLTGKPLSAQTKTTQWWPSTGTVILGGGHVSDATSADMAKRLIALAGGPDALIVIIPTADNLLPPQVGRRGKASNPEDIKAWWKSMGANNVAILHTRDQKVANSEVFVKVLRAAGAVFIQGGQSMLLEAAYRGTLVEKELKALLARGGTIAGNSAGSIAIGCMWLTWTPDPFGIRTQDLGLLPNVAVSPHADAATDYSTDSEVLKYLVGHPGPIGIDIDENTLLILGKGHAEVSGVGHVTIIDATRDKTKPVYNLKPGIYDNLKY
jgi:cyanophycinase